MARVAERPIGKPRSYGPGLLALEDVGCGGSSSSSCANPFGGRGSSSSSAGAAPRQNRLLAPSEIEELRRDDFLLGRNLPECEDVGAGVAVDQTFAELDVALKCRDLRGAEAIWRRMAHMWKEGSSAVFVERPDLRAVASRYISAMTPQILDKLETALDRGDRFAARQEHQRLDDLSVVNTKLASRAAGISGGTPLSSHNGIPLFADGPNERGRRAQLEARYQQLVNRSGPLMCSLLPDIWFSFCWNPCTGDKAVQQPSLSPSLR